jgi:hypothetical protein
MILELLILIYFISGSLRQWEVNNVIFVIYLNIALAVLEVKIKHLSTYLNHLAGTKFMHVNSHLSKSHAQASPGLQSGTLIIRTSLSTIYYFPSPTGRERQAWEWGRKAEGISAQRTKSRASCQYSALVTPEDSVPNLTLPSLLEEVRGEQAAPSLLLWPWGFQVQRGTPHPFTHCFLVCFPSGMHQCISGLRPALTPACSPQAPSACTCSWLDMLWVGHPWLPALGSWGLFTLACTPCLLCSGGGESSPKHHRK